MATSYTVTNVTGTGPFTLPSDIELASLQVMSHFEQSD